MAYRIPVMLTPSQVKAVLEAFPVNGSKEGVGIQALKALQNHQNKVRDAENLLARIRDTDEEDTGKVVDTVISRMRNQE